MKNKKQATHLSKTPLLGDYLVKGNRKKCLK